MFFGKKKEVNHQAKVVFFEGLQGFNQNHRCDLIKEGDTLIIKQMKPEVQATMSLSQIQTIDILSENDFLTRYKHTNIAPPKDVSSFSKFYLVINFTGSDGHAKMVAFWMTYMECRKIYKFVELLNANKPVKNYSL